MKYIKTGTIQNLLAQADEDNRPLYITGPIGCGKTAAIEYFYRRISHWTIDCADGRIEQKTIPSKIRPRVVIFDNVSYLEEEASRKYVLDMLTRSDKHIIFTSRAPRPAWLISKTMDENVLLADHRDFRLSKEQVFRLMEELDVNAPEEEMLKVMEDSRSNPLVISCIAYYMKEIGVYSKEVNTFARINYHTYLDNELLGRLSHQEAEFLLAMSWYPSFSFDLARELNDGLDRGKSNDSGCEGERNFMSYVIDYSGDIPCGRRYGVGRKDRIRCLQDSCVQSEGDVFDSIVHNELIRFGKVDYLILGELLGLCAGSALDVDGNGSEVYSLGIEGEIDGVCVIVYHALYRNPARSSGCRLNWNRHGINRNLRLEIGLFRLAGSCEQA